MVAQFVRVHARACMHVSPSVFAIVGLQANRGSMGCEGRAHASGHPSSEGRKGETPRVGDQEG